jgi:hypothetical protein
MVTILRRVWTTLKAAPRCGVACPGRVSEGDGRESGNRIVHRIGCGRRVPLGANSKQTIRAGSAVCAQFVLRAFCKAYFQSLTIEYRFREPMLALCLPRSAGDLLQTRGGAPRGFSGSDRGTRMGTVNRGSEYGA